MEKKSICVQFYIHLDLNWAVQYINMIYYLNNMSFFTT